MAHGIKADTEQQAPETTHTLVGRFIRLVGFCVLTGTALAILASVVLLPMLGQRNALRYRRDCQAVRVREAEATIRTYDRLIAEAPRNEELTQRLAWSKLGLLPRNEEIVVNPDAPPAPQPGMITPAKFADPAEPDPRVASLAMKLQSPGRRRGLLVMAGGMLVASLLLFAPPSWRARRDPRILPKPVMISRAKA